MLTATVGEPGLVGGASGDSLGWWEEPLGIAWDARLVDELIKGRKPLAVTGNSGSS